METRPDASIMSHVKDLPAPRMERAKTHRLLDILVIAWGSVMAGGDGVQDMVRFGKRNQAWLEQFLDLPPGMPSHDPFGRVLARLHPTCFHECGGSWTHAVARVNQ